MEYVTCMANTKWGQQSQCSFEAKHGRNMSCLVAGHPFTLRRGNYERCVWLRLSRVLVQPETHTI